MVVTGVNFAFYHLLGTWVGAALSSDVKLVLFVVVYMKLCSTGTQFILF
jgi:hypothetical protein